MADSVKQIQIEKNGPYVVQGNIPLVRKTQVVSENGEPLSWKKEGEYHALEDGYQLCRCGQSSDKPFCDGTHHAIGFDGTETADPGLTQDRQIKFEGGTHLVVSKDPSLCMEAGYCGLREAALAHYVTHSDDSTARTIAIAMVERCPSGSLTYHIEEGEPDIEPDLPQQIADTTEITSDGPIAGPLWVMGGITIQRSDGQAMETRNRVTLCNCGLSANKPLCDGTHRSAAEQAARARK